MTETEDTEIDFQLLQKSINEHNFLLSPPRREKAPVLQDETALLEAMLVQIPEGYKLLSKPNGIQLELDNTLTEPQEVDEPVSPHHLAVINESPERESSHKSQQGELGSLNLSKISPTGDFNSKGSEDTAQKEEKYASINDTEPEVVRKDSRTDSPTQAQVLEQEFHQFDRGIGRTQTIDSEYFIRRQSMQNRFSEDENAEAGGLDLRRKINLDPTPAGTSVASKDAFVGQKANKDQSRQSLEFARPQSQPQKISDHSRSNQSNHAEDDDQEDNILSAYLGKSQVDVSERQKPSFRQEQTDDEENGLSQVVDFFGMNMLQEEHLLRKAADKQIVSAQTDKGYHGQPILGFRREDLGSQRLLNTSMGSDTSFGKPKDEANHPEDPDYEDRNDTSREEDNLAAYLGKQQAGYGKNIFTEYTSRDHEASEQRDNLHNSFYPQDHSKQSDPRKQTAKSDSRRANASQSVSIEVDDYFENPQASGSSHQQQKSKPTSQDMSRRVHESSFSHHPTAAPELPNFTKKNVYATETSGSVLPPKNNRNPEPIFQEAKKNLKQDEVDWQALVDDIQRSESSIVQQSFQQEESFQDLSHQYLPIQMQKQPLKPAKVMSEKVFENPPVPQRRPDFQHRGPQSLTGDAFHQDNSSMRSAGLKTHSLPDDPFQRSQVLAEAAKKGINVAASLTSQYTGTSNQQVSLPSASSSHKHMLAQPTHDMSVDSFGHNKENSNPFAMNSVAGGSVHSAQAGIGSGPTSDRARLLIKLREETNFLKDLHTKKLTQVEQMKAKKQQLEQYLRRAEESYTLKTNRILEVKREINSAQVEYVGSRSPRTILWRS